MNLRQIIHCYGCYGLWPHNKLWDIYRWAWMTFSQIYNCYGCYEICYQSEIWLIYPSLYTQHWITLGQIRCFGCYGIWPHNRLWQPWIWTWDRVFIAMGAMDNDLLMNYEIFTDDLVWLLVKLIIAMGAMKFVIKMRMAYHLCEFIHALSKCFIFTIPCQTCRNLQRILIDALHVWHLNGYHLFEWIHAP